MPSGIVKTKRDERLWEKAKSLAAEAGYNEDYAYIMRIYKQMRPDTKFEGNPRYSAQLKQSDLDDAETLGDLRSEVAAYILEMICPDLDSQEYYDEALLCRLAAQDLFQTTDDDDVDEVEPWQEDLCAVEPSDVAKDILKLMILMDKAQSTSNDAARLGRVLCMTRLCDGLDLYNAEGLTQRVKDYLVEVDEED